MQRATTNARRLYGGESFIVGQIILTDRVGVAHRSVMAIGVAILRLSVIRIAWIADGHGFNNGICLRIGSSAKQRGGDDGEGVFFHRRYRSQANPHHGNRWQINECAFSRRHVLLLGNCLWAESR